MLFRFQATQGARLKSMPMVILALSTWTCGVLFALIRTENILFYSAPDDESRSRFRLIRDKGSVPQRAIVGDVRVPDHVTSVAIFILLSIRLLIMLIKVADSR